MESSLNDIYDLLLAGQTLELDFSDAEETERFRIQLHQFKSRRDKHLLSIGAVGEGEIDSLSFLVKKYLDSERRTAKIRFKPKSSNKKFSIRIVEEDES